MMRVHDLVDKMVLFLFSISITCPTSAAAIIDYPLVIKNEVRFCSFTAAKNKNFFFHFSGMIRLQ
jgi:hypothetical protein